MRSLAALLFVFLSLSACAPLTTLSTGGGQSSTSLGPDNVAVTPDASTLPQRIKAGLEWLWNSYTVLQAKGAVPGLEDLKNDIVDLEAAAGHGDLMAALNLYNRARARVTAIAEVVRK